MNLNDFLTRVKNNQTVDFKETIDVITQHYDYQATTFSNGLTEPVLNEAGRNEGSCKIFAFAQLHDLSADQTLSLFGDFYRKDVLENPQGNDHQNIRNFIRDGWAGIVFQGQALQAK